MRQEFKCDICNKGYPTEEEALACEANHARVEALKQKEKEEALAKHEERVQTEAKITLAIEEFIKKYHSAPEITLTEECQDIVRKELNDSMNKFIDYVIEKLLDD